MFFFAQYESLAELRVEIRYPTVITANSASSRTVLEVASRLIPSGWSMQRSGDITLRLQSLTRLNEGGTGMAQPAFERLVEDRRLFGNRRLPFRVAALAREFGYPSFSDAQKAMNARVEASNGARQLGP